MEIDVHGYCVREALKETVFRTKPLISDLKPSVFSLYPENFLNLFGRIASISGQICPPTSYTFYVS